MRTKHMALHVPDLEHAEEYYRHVFDLDVVTREAPSSGDLADDEAWAQLPHAATW
jgi:catechol-2,3-dioxygenase